MQTILYNMFYEPSITERATIKAKDGMALAVHYPGKPLWVWTENSIEDLIKSPIEGFCSLCKLCDFCYGSGYKCTAFDKLCAFFTECIRVCGGKIDGMVAPDWAVDFFIHEFCLNNPNFRDYYCKCQNYQKWEVAAFFLSSPVKHFSNGNLILLENRHIPLIKEWIGQFYMEALRLTLSYEDKINIASALIIGNLGRRLYGLENDGIIKAMGMIVPLMSKNMSRLNLIYTPYRNQGYGRDITAMLSAMIQSQGKTPVLYTRVDNSAAMKLYASLGFVEAGRLTEARFVMG